MPDFKFFIKWLMQFRRLGRGEAGIEMWSDSGLCYNQEYSPGDLHRSLCKYFAVIQKKRPSGKRPVVLDLGGGTGEWAELAATAGADVHLVDFGRVNQIREKVAERNARVGRNAIRFSPRNVLTIDKDFIRQCAPDVITLFNSLHFLPPEGVETLLKNIALTVPAETLICMTFKGLNDENLSLDTGKKNKFRLKRTKTLERSDKRPPFYFHHPDEIRFLAHTFGLVMTQNESFRAGRLWGRSKYLDYGLVFQKVPRYERNTEPYNVPLSASRLQLL